MASTEFLTDDEMPPVCICCGAVATRTVARNYRIDETSVYDVAAGVERSGAWTMALPVCDQHRRHWLWRQVVGVCAILVLLALLMLCTYLNRPWWMVAPALMVGGLLLGLYLTAVHSGKVTAARLVLKRVAPEFRDALLAAREVRNAQWNKQMEAHQRPPRPLDEGPNPFANLG